MASFSISGIQISGLAAAVPKNTESNRDYDFISLAERELLIKTTGIEQRRVALPGMTTSDLCYAAADQLLNKLEWNREEIALLVFVSQSEDYYLPATAILLQNRLGLPKTCMAFDIGLGCSGFVYGLSVVAGMMKSSGIKRGLLLNGDTSSFVCSKEDKSSYPLFGDAGAATALELSDSAPAIYFNLNSDGSGHKAIFIPDGGSRNKYSEDSFKMKAVSDGIVRSDFHLALNGIAIFNFSLIEVPRIIENLLAESETDRKDVDYYVLHQANLLINDSIRKKLALPAGKFPLTLGKYGNTSSASIPLTIVSELGRELSERPLSLLCAGFGVGLSWAAVLIETKKVLTLPVVEI